MNKTKILGGEIFKDISERRHADALKKINDAHKEFLTRFMNDNPGFTNLAALRGNTCFN